MHRRRQMAGSNRLLAALPSAERNLFEPHLKPMSIAAGQSLFRPGDDVVSTYFPCDGTIVSLVVPLKDGSSMEGAMVGCEGAAGGIASNGYKPAYSLATVQIAGAALKLPVRVLEKAKANSALVRDHFARYADCLIAQLMQTVACNAAHEFDARLARWLLCMHDRLGSSKLPITHELIAERLGVQRTYTTRTIKALEKRGAIKTGRGAIYIVDRPKLKKCSCDCYDSVRRHFEALLPAVYPTP